MDQTIVMLYAAAAKMRNKKRRSGRYDEEVHAQEVSAYNRAMEIYNASGEVDPETDEFFARWLSLINMIDPNPPPAA